MANNNVEIGGYDGYGYGDGYGFGDGDGYGYGDDGYGYGFGYGDDGYGYGYGYGFGFGDGYGFGYGYGFGFGDGDDGYGYGSGFGDGSGSGYGYGSQEVIIPSHTPWMAYHYIRREGVAFFLRGGERTMAGASLHKNDIEMCKRGLHASFSPGDAKKYAPADAVLTEVLVWGRILIDKDKLVATDRKLVRVLER
jgi:hypothetical protein